ncbi:MAG TPA: methionine adenosyltransferase domain-containing protein, partial [Bacteroidales bacterium]|nr:methionine adenosyltransferase domain-containing protein [Bacteroidales bacterium]
PSKVDRSAAYAARHIAKNMVAAGVAREMLVQVSYAIGVAEPVGIFVNTFGTSKVEQSDGEIAKIIDKMFDLRPAIIEKVYDLRKPIYSETAAYGHMGRQPRTIEKTFKSFNSRPDKKITVRLFSWEELNKVSAIKKAFGLE